jgi:hypothetical protein
MDSERSCGGVDARLQPAREKQGLDQTSRIRGEKEHEDRIVPVDEKIRDRYAGSAVDRVAGGEDCRRGEAVRV